MAYQAVIGLEVHLQLKTKSKIFSACPQEYHGAEPNTFTDPFTLGLPGTLPTLNREAVELAMMFGLGLNCDVAGFTQFHRKNYFYPDAPKNFQLSQYDRPIARDGFLDVTLEDGTTHRIRIKRAHLEDDAGKLTHPTYAPYSMLDLNRAGSSLLEMVTEADITGAEQARAFLESVQAIAQALGVSDATPEEGKMRCDVNLSLHRPGEPWGTKCEVKNLNSFRSVARAIEFESARQARILDAGGRITQDTLGWDEGGQKTFLMRTKEGEADYRYFPEPDLPPLDITPEWIARVRERMPELPAQKLERYLAVGVRAADAQTLSLSVPLSRFFDEALTAQPRPDAQKLANWLLGDVSGLLAAREETLDGSALRPAYLAALVGLIDAGTISGKIAKDLLPDVLAGHDPAALVQERGLSVVTDTAAIDAAIDAAMAADPATVEKVRGGNAKAMNALFGPVMKAMGGQAKPEVVRERLTAKLGLS
ncbi:Asp-tRNA(Asn)/Glu-tRNA(Gln) amidotransferase subunit GatB [Deinococcus soli (ex Cha et al. 2016)]|uniref:Aspartyl/glutamyl-tRNA(Asn/Gln) amidotransferase subunit B n=2 Tax=Deinococcus soli (ex Cha et al. 2016) TaxID=1309411 RepID=A0AAE4BJX6_9DEIO|nr:Asp-tRNA(Asn)/Glu-tRNA(Gln) amidotransferase subunit GatB [Deinococcus soli (ex Cha et al. 2016)]MDR6217068.1 aspartyl-tRNA(Asn)/glutamyl-tRNA(Gln) amidotransferase subunit B [Deinococcus soli (ex Cha et al. 2016)]MDR6327889.1 aspartyl-tRNA(Asn)/glutamyl-tRNA(Gln) amidotransferase subunit B [Deinococcus soli (ex Cha et al. 2016)]MDR6750164.1 aspartyl-tRNA(Asn)/glutamyl-tRNA(Gln) amidotransferase subunit B [Deinococcus soli (ex Cha et al. 2016)]